MVFAALIGGLVGSRLDYLIQNWDEVSDDLLGNIFSGSGLVACLCGALRQVRMLELALVFWGGVKNTPDRYLI